MLYEFTNHKKSQVSGILRRLKISIPRGYKIKTPVIKSYGWVLIIF